MLSLKEGSIGWVPYSRIWRATLGVMGMVAGSGGHEFDVFSRVMESFRSEGSWRDGRVG